MLIPVVVQQMLPPTTPGGIEILPVPACRQYASLPLRTSSDLSCTFAGPVADFVEALHRTNMCFRDRSDMRWR
jgi:hypothetical protein